MKINSTVGITRQRLGRPRGRRDGVALVIVLAFVVLLTGLIVAFFSRSLLDRQISNSSVSRGKVSAFADGAANTIISELKQEIVLSSSATPLTVGTLTTGTLYTPLTPSAMLPQLSGTDGFAAPPNLLKTSGAGQLFYSGTYGTIPASGVSNVSIVSSTTPSLNGRYFTPAYWNAHYLLPLQTGTVTDATPANGSFVPPSWVLVARDGSNPTSTTVTAGMTATGTDPVVGRYAFAIYHEGGLLDVNAAGYPHTSGTGAVAANYTFSSTHKDSIAYADLTQLPGGLTQAQVDELVAWRDYASIQVPGGASFLKASTAFTTTSADNYNILVVSNSTGYLGISATATYLNQTDRMFGNRQELIKFMETGLGVSGAGLNVLNYLTTFSRDLNQPSYIPAIQQPGSTAPVVLPTGSGGNSAYGGDPVINPSFPAVRVQSSFQRNDGSTAKVGEPLVNKRFALQRLAWITYKGPSANRNESDPDIQALIMNDGVPWSYLQLGTAQNIENYFGLNWDSANNRWNYNVHLGGTPTNQFIMLVGRPLNNASPDPTKYVEDANRDPNFFELLKAGIAVGSLGKAATISDTAATAPTGYSSSEVPANMRYNFDSSVDYHVIQIGANILSEVNPTSYPVRITFDDGSSRGAWEFRGVTDLPYLSYVFNGVLRTQAPNPAPPSGNNSDYADNSPYQYPIASNTTSLTTSGSAYMIQVPAVWNPYDPNGTTGVLRPSQFRIVIDSNDPVTLSGTNPSPDIQVWHATEASKSTSSAPTGNQGLAADNPSYSFNGTGVGKTTEQPGGIGTAVNDMVTFSDSNGLLYREPTLIFSAKAPGNATRVSGNITTGIDANPLPLETDGLKGPWAPLVLGQFPLAFVTSGTTYYAGIGLMGSVGGAGDNRVYFTYRLQYLDPTNANWVTYDTKYGRTTDGMFSFQYKTNDTPSVTLGANYPPGLNPYSWASAMDPRSARFGLISDTINQQRVPTSAVEPTAMTAPWIYNATGATTVGITYPIRQDDSGGFYFANLDGNNTVPGAPNTARDFALLYSWNSPTTDIPFPSFSAGWTTPMQIVSNHGTSNVWMFAPGMYAQNNPGAPFFQSSTGTVQPSYYADPDGVVRRAAGAYVPYEPGMLSGSTTIGLPPASIQGYSGAPQSNPPSTTPATSAGLTFTQAQSRPLLLHRPFRSVAELGYVFRDLPWKNLDFFTPESGDAGLLDLFCTNETSDPNGLIAGKVNLNTRQTPVLTAIVSGAYLDDPKITNTTVGSLSPIVASTIAGALTTRTNESNGTLQNLSELVGKWNSAVAISGTVNYSPSAIGNAGLDLPKGYVDGRSSYTGFSGASLTSGTAPDNLSAVFAVPGIFNTVSASSILPLQKSVSLIQRFREAPIRALASAGQTRVWNLLIDVVAQTGQYPTFANGSLANFVVEGQQHYWVHVAIDRLTGQVLDKQIEQVTE